MIRIPLFGRFAPVAAAEVFPYCRATGGQMSSTCRGKSPGLAASLFASRRYRKDGWRPTMIWQGFPGFRHGSPLPGQSGFPPASDVPADRYGYDRLRSVPYVVAGVADAIGSVAFHFRHRPFYGHSVVLVVRSVLRSLSVLQSLPDA